MKERIAEIPLVDLLVCFQREKNPSEAEGICHLGGVMGEKEIEGCPRL